MRYLLIVLVLVMAVPVMALDGEVFVDGAITSLSGGNVLEKTNYTLTGELRHTIDSFTPYFKGEVDFNSAFTAGSKGYELGVEYKVGGGLIMRAGYNSEIFPDESKQSLYKIGAGFRF